MNRSDGKERLKARRDTLPTNHQATILLLEPGKCALCLEPRDRLLDRSAASFPGLPDPLGDLCPNTPLPQLLPQRFGIIAFIRGEDFKAFARTPPFARAHLERIKQRHNLRPLVPIGWRSPVRQRHPVSLRETVDQNPFAFPPAGDALAATLARGKKNHRRRHRPTESCPAPQPDR